MMTVKVYAYQPGVSMGNIIWAPAHRMMGGKFPPSHPCHANPRPVVFSHADQPESDDPLGRFRALGYLASCFPEGDGISFKPPPEGRTSKQMVEDIERCFGWRVEVRR